MPCGGAETLGLDFCDVCICSDKVCYRCQKTKTLGEFNRTRVPHILKMKENKGRRFACQECESKMDKKYSKLYEVSPKSVIDYNGKRVYFSCLDRESSLCFDEKGEIFPLPIGVWVEVLSGEDYNEINEILKNKETK
jgi:hypothetical protein